MPRSTALLISSDVVLFEAVEEIATSVPGLGLEVFPGVAEADFRLWGDDVVLVLVHLEGPVSLDETAGLLRRLGAAKRSIATLVLSDRHQPDQALTLLRLGAADYLSRPLDLGRLAYLVDVLTVRGRYQAASRPCVAVTSPSHEQARSQAHSQAPRTIGEKDPLIYAPGSMVGQVMDQVQRVAPQDTTILLGGETGTGKTKLAQLVHELSSRRNEPFRAINCGALSPNLMESEMFGHVRGAFTGADRDRTGKFTEVGRGTLLLDDIEALSLALQAKLLRAIEERVFEPVGGNKSLSMQARLITASSRNLEQEVAEGRFRSDLYYRLNVVGFYLVPLRERSRAEIATIARHFMTQFSQGRGGQVRNIAPDALDALCDYHWPGNIRELRNVIERAIALCPDTVIQIDDLPPNIREVHSAVGLPVATVVREVADPVCSTTLATLAQTKGEAEATRIVEALERNNNNRLRAAAELGISRMTLYKKLHQYGLMGARV
jgi:DNA-binding NtrC family response regulator